MFCSIRQNREGMAKAFFKHADVTIRTIIPINGAAFAAYALAWMGIFQVGALLIGRLSGWLLSYPLQLALIPHSQSSQLKWY